MVGNRFQHGALDLESVETRPVMQGEQPTDIAKLEKNRATSLIEEFMVAANGVMARHFEEAKVASIRRIVRVHEALGPHRGAGRGGWGRTLPAESDSKSLNDFLLARKKADPERFPDLSLAVVKLMGPGRVCTGACRC